MIFGLKAKLAVGAIAVSAAFGAGWLVKGKFEDSKDLAALEAQQALIEKVREGQAQVSKQVAEHLSQMQGTERVIDRGIIREISKPIYQRVCLPDRAVRLLNDAARNQAPGESDGEVPEGSASAD